MRRVLFLLLGMALSTLISTVIYVPYVGTLILAYGFGRGFVWPIADRIVARLERWSAEGKA